MESVFFLIEIGLKELLGLLDYRIFSSIFNKQVTNQRILRGAGCGNANDHFVDVKSNPIGIDNISIKLVKNMFPYISGFLIHIFNSNLMTAQFPVKRKMARVVLIPKSNFIRRPEDLKTILILSSLSILWNTF